MPDFVLEAKELTKTYGSLTAVDCVTLHVKPGECLALLGPNGAGKTTTVEMLEGLLSPDRGDIRLFGKSLASERAEILQRVGVLLQETSLYKKLSVRETLELFASFFRRSAAPMEIIGLLGLTEKANARLEQLSGGQKQRLYLGCALINEPDFIFLDEPTTGLDPQARRLIWDLLASIKKQGRSMLLTTHYMEEAEILADRVAVIDHGKIIAEGTPKSLIETIGGEQVLWVAFDAGQREEWDLKSALVSRLPWFEEAVKQEDGFEVTTSQAVNHIPELTNVAKDLGINIASLQMRSTTLEDVFLKLTGRSIRDA